MMLLADIGNTRVKWAQAQGRELSGHGTALHAGLPPAGIWPKAWAGLPRPQRIVVSNVAGAALAQSLRVYCEQQFQLAPEFLTPSSRAVGVSNGYLDPAQLGADRWAAVVGAFSRYGGPAGVIGCGTAITVDTVNGEGRHLGGLIAPGLAVMRRALAEAAPVLPADANGDSVLFARDTRSAVSSGVLRAAAGFIERVVAEIRERQGAQVKWLLTGGDAEALQAVLREPFTLAPHLVLEGLAVLAEARP
ncbi:MAG: type III pantothenate kinase [Gammaproteobacteria bacterium]|nr:type III pantothenate kinase [Gammaproteobacteria bacterium]MBU6509973.1 type III pantothenate kinase [Gammaproteobacteria bacterium]MDE2108697.1 type III pantothenate kinase [Gammaproteobacteria bacterium]MDE2460060.1 type III pantothenate kinase [Gammaproteobacteria bacterium]